MVSIFMPLDMDEDGVRLLETRAPFSSCWHLLLERRVVPLLPLRTTFGLQGGKFNYSHLCPLVCSCTSVAVNSLSWTLMVNPTNLHIHDHQHPHQHHLPLTLGRRLGKRLNPESAITCRLLSVTSVLGLSVVFL